MKKLKLKHDMAAAARHRRPAFAGRVREGLTSWNDTMLEMAASGPRHGTRWLRAGAAFTPSTLAVGALGVALSQGVMAASLNLTNTAFTLKSNNLKGTGLGLYLNKANNQDASAKPAARVAISSATLDGFCGIVSPATTPGIYLLITAGPQVTGTPTGSETIVASNLFLEASSLTGSATQNSLISNAILGVSADNVKLPTGAGGSGVVMPQTSPFGTDGTPGSFGLQGSGFDQSTGAVTPGQITVPDLNVQTYDTEIAGNLTLPNLKIRASASLPTC